MSVFQLLFAAVFSSLFVLVVVGLYLVAREVMEEYDDGG
jgi:hypothetical protein